MALLSAVSSAPASFQLSHFSPRTVQYTSRTCAFLLSSKTRRVCRSFASCGGASTSSLFGHRLVGNSVVSVPNFGASSGAVFGKACVLGFAAMGSSASTPDAASMEVNASSTAGVGSKSIHGFVVQDIDGNEVELSKYKGKVLLVVNVASQCGLTTSNYKELAEIYSKYKDQDFEILAFPCNQFGSQEPGSNEQIKEFACTRFKAEYPIFNKIDVNGANAAPLYKFLKEKKGGGLLGDSIKWNFAKFLVDKDGNVVDRYAPTTSPSKIEKDIKKLL